MFLAISPTSSPLAPLVFGGSGDDFGAATKTGGSVEGDAGDRLEAGMR